MKVFANVVIADQQLVGNIEAFERLAQGDIGLCIAVIREVAGEHDQIRVGAGYLDMCNRRIQSGGRVNPDDLTAFRHDVYIGKDDDFLQS